MRYILFVLLLAGCGMEEVGDHAAKPTPSPVATRPPTPETRPWYAPCEDPDNPCPTVAPDERHPDGIITYVYCEEGDTEYTDVLDCPSWEKATPTPTPTPEEEVTE